MRRIQSTSNTVLKRRASAKAPKSIIEQSLRQQGFTVIAGVDEVGRGAWAGPLVAGAVVLRPRGRRLYNIRDSKMLSAGARQRLTKSIKRRAGSWAIGQVTARELNRIGLAKAIRLSQFRAITNLKHKPSIIICDGIGKYQIRNVRTNYFIKADQKILSVACASIIAKTHRDRLMRTLGRRYPHYGFEKNKGYGTALHQQAIKKYGVCAEHRSVFNIRIISNLDR